jgi:hypothetical protein
MSELPETTVTDKGGEFTPQIFSVDDIDTEEVVAPEPEAEKPDETEIEVEGKKDVDVEESETKKLNKELQELKGEILKLSQKKDVVPPPKAETPEKLTRQQIVGILKEHKDDPEVLANVIEYLAEQKATDIKDSTVKDMNYKQWSSNLSGIASKILHDDEDGYLAANPKVSGSLNEYAENLGLRDHPVGKLAAYAIMRLSEQVKAKPVEDVKSTKAETKPSTRVMDKTRTFDQLSKAKGLTADQLAVAKKFGVKPETYVKFLRRS